MKKKQAIIDILLSQMEKNESIPPLSNNSLLLQREVTKDSPDFKKIGNMIKSDPALTSHILKIANSPVYKGLEQVDNVKEAMLRLGINEIKNVVIWAMHQSNFKTQDLFIKKFKKNLWFHSLSCATGALWAAKYLGLENIAQRAFIAGLLHDMGALYLLTALEKIKSARKIENYPSEFVLNELINQFHTEQGYELLKNWNLPEPFLIVARDHHIQEFDQSDLLLVLIRLINNICKKIETGNKVHDTAAIVASTEAAVLNLTELGIAEIEIVIEAAQEKFKTLF
ncbi:MAG: HDOD domain-containing protein [Desulfobacula sp.]|nr:HDOD domain-containing protein [Desulfobacula sp.]